MEIKWHGNTCFEIKNKEKKLIINPKQQEEKSMADVVLSSLNEEPAGVEGVQKVFDSPGEYEVKDIPIIGFKAWTKAKSKEEKEGGGDTTIIFYFEINGIKFCHLGELGHTLTGDMVKEIEDVDVLMVDIGEKSNLDSKKIMDILEAIEPRVVIPMGEGDFSRSINDLSVDNMEKHDKYTIKSRSDLPEDKRLYVLLKKV
ncbi:hypothetical protein GF366_01330 [Candidatus Peregrinibacteria bacterium]|nr:hypothetical protein [Candidatus Peregrinibacteria bacterium]